MRLPWVSRAAFDLVSQERDWLRVEVNRLSDEAKSLTNAVMQNARLVPVFDKGGARPIHKYPVRKTIAQRGRELEKLEAAK